MRCATGIAHVVISLGAEGALWVNASGMDCQTAFNGGGQHRGAGDSMVGGLIYGLLMRDLNMLPILRYRRCGHGREPKQCRYYRRTQLAAMMARVDKTATNSRRGIMKTLLIVTPVSDRLVPIWRRPAGRGGTKTRISL